MTSSAQGRVQRYLVIVEYFGTRFQGWQKQKHRPDLRTVQGTVETAFGKFVGQPITCSGSSRTDIGVHALANACHVDIERVSKRRPGEVVPPYEPWVIRRAVNHFLKGDAGDVKVLEVQPVSMKFHARFMARGRTYHYRIIAGTVQPSVFEKDRAWHVAPNLNLSAMQEASQILVGHHDFSSFRGGGCQATSPFRTLDELQVCKMPAAFSDSFPKTSEQSSRQSCNSDSGFHEHVNSTCDHRTGETAFSIPATLSSPCTYIVTARARSFLYHQVRLMVGVLKGVGSGVLTVQDVERILAARSVRAVPEMAPACGLYLAEVKYDLHDYKEGSTPYLHETAAVSSEFENDFA